MKAVSARDAAKRVGAGWWWLLLIVTLSVPTLLGAAFVNYRSLYWALGFAMVWILVAAKVGHRLGEEGYLTEEELKEREEQDQA